LTHGGTLLRASYMSGTLDYTWFGNSGKGSESGRRFASNKGQDYFAIIGKFLPHPAVQSGEAGAGF